MTGSPDRVMGPLTISTADDMHVLGVALGTRLQAGDLVLLTGDLGAGKTTLAAGIGAGLQVHGPVTSPTFVIAREHPPLGDGPWLVHVDAYRLGGIDELDDLDLATSLDSAVLLVEWGHGLAEHLAAERLEVVITRGVGVADDGRDPERREVSLRPAGSRWDPAALRDILGRAVGSG